jgi:hypothetical protein
MDNHWENEVAALLRDLSSAQSDLLSLLADKRSQLLKPNAEALQAMQPREQALVERLQACHDRRTNLLKQAAVEGLPATSLTTLAEAVTPSGNSPVKAQLTQAARQSRLLQHQSLAQWVLVQRSLLHLSQLLEIIATGGQLRPTYGKEDLSGATGTLVDRAA